MARRVFFSFEYRHDVTRAMVVRNSWVTQGKEAAGFVDAAELEEVKEGRRRCYQALDSRSATWNVGDRGTCRLPHMFERIRRIRNRAKREKG